MSEELAPNPQDVGRPDRFDRADTPCRPPACIIDAEPVAIRRCPQTFSKISWDFQDQDRGSCSNKQRPIGKCQRQSETLA
jgi:hypothetical protein